MAKISKIARNNQRKEMVVKHAAKRAELKAIINNPNSTFEDVDAAVLRLSKMPRNGSASRVRNRCSQSGRSRAYLRKFGMSRIAMRELSLQGQIPGVIKSSW